MKKLLLCLATMIFCSSPLNGNSAADIDRWTACGPWSADILAFSVDPHTSSTLYAGTNGYGVYKSIDGGEIWTPSNDHLQKSIIRVLAVDPATPTTLYAGTHNGITPSFGGAYKSTDGGENWTASNTGLSISSVAADVRALVIDPNSPATLYAGTAASGGLYSETDAGGVFKSTDGGENWTAMNNGLPTYPSNGNTHIYDIYTLTIDPITSATLYAGMDAGGVYKSTDGGNSWTASSIGLEGADVRVNTLAIDLLAPSTLYAGNFKGVFKSTNAGDSWTAMNDGLPVTSNGIDIQYLSIDPLTPSTLYVYTYSGGVFKSTDAGARWTAMNDGLPTYTSDDKTYLINALAIDPLEPLNLYASLMDHVVFKSTDGGENWTAMNNGLPGDEIGDLTIDPLTPSTIYAGIAASINQYHFGVYKSTDEGIDWTKSSSDLQGSTIKALAIDPLTPFTLYTASGIGVFKSTDGGQEWTVTLTDLSLTVRALAIDPFTPSTIYAGADGASVFKSVDSGRTWTKFNNGLPKFGKYAVRPQPAIIFTLCINPITSSTLYAGTDAGGVFKSTDGGINWSAINKGLPTYTVNNTTYTSAVYALSIDPLVSSILYAGTDTGEIYKSTDEGGSWVGSSSGLSGDEVKALCVDPFTPSTLYAGTNGAEVFKSIDSGSSWVAIGSGLGDLSLNTLLVDPFMPSSLYAGTSNGVYVITADTTSKDENGDGRKNECFIRAVIP